MIEWGLLKGNPDPRTMEEASSPGFCIPYPTSVLEPVLFYDLAPGEKKHLRRNKLVTAMRSLHKSSRIPERGTAWVKLEIQKKR